MPECVPDPTFNQLTVCVKEIQNLHSTCLLCIVEIIFKSWSIIQVKIEAMCCVIECLVGGNCEIELL